ncbi:MAG: hypothetical protein P8174_04345 [Gemmatimonadota bacterium]
MRGTYPYALEVDAGAECREERRLDVAGCPGGGIVGPGHDVDGTDTSAPVVVYTRVGDAAQGADQLLGATRKRVGACILGSFNIAHHGTDRVCPLDTCRRPGHCQPA